jgi:hypothetical protein
MHACAVLNLRGPAFGSGSGECLACFVSRQEAVRRNCNREVERCVGVLLQQLLPELSAGEPSVAA